MSFSNRPLTDRQRSNMISKIEVNSDRCWLYTGSVNSDGYAQINGQSGARVMWEEFIGPLGDLTIDHLCRVRHCLNPVHLEPVTLKVNVQRAYRDNPKEHWLETHPERRQTHCKRGHEYTPENSHIFANGVTRYCKTCHNARQAKYREAS